MALYQAGLVRDRLRQAHAELVAEDAVELVPIRTTGDRVQTRLLAEIGGKGLFTKEIEEALLDRHIDLAVHSLKDMETHLPAGLEIGCVLPRDDPRDVVVSRNGMPLAELPIGARVGTASLRRRAQLLQRRGDLSIVPIRGNVGTRLDKFAAGGSRRWCWHCAGSNGSAGGGGDRDPVARGDAAGGGTGRAGDRVPCGRRELGRLLAPLNDPASAICVGAERAMLAALDGSGRTPLAGRARLPAPPHPTRCPLRLPRGTGRHLPRGAGEEPRSLGWQFCASPRSGSGL
jgi:hydroxymethylbilane synthase